MSDQVPQRSPGNRAKLWSVGSTLFAWASFLVVAGACLWLVGGVLWQGMQHWSWSFLWQAPTDVGRSGGIGPMILSTLLVVLICLAVSLPLGLGASLFLANYTRGGAAGWLIRRSLDILAGVPSIVFGLFGSAFFCEFLGFGSSVLAGGLTLSCMVLPILVRITEQGIRDVPAGHLQGAAALGLGQWTTTRQVILPAALPALAAGLALGTGRALAETAALIFTSGYSTRAPSSLFDSGRTLSVHIYDMSMNVSGGNPAAAATAAVLVLMLVLINTSTFVLSRWVFAGRESTVSRLINRGVFR